MKRKSPYRHKVKGHTRAGKPVHNYMRGQGDKTVAVRRKSRSRVVGGSSNHSSNLSEIAYDVNIYYADYRSERYSVDAKDYPSALMGGLEQRDTIEPPKIVRMRRSR